MKFFRITARAFFFLFLAFDITIFTLIYLIGGNVSSDYKINKGDVLHIDSYVPVTAEYDGTRMSGAALNQDVGDTFNVDLKLFGVIPFSKVNVEVVDEMYVAVLGNPFGMKIYTDGVLVIDLTDVDSEKGTVNPATQAGIKKGDYILTVNGKKITCNEDLSDVVLNSGGKSLKVEVLRGNTKVFYNVKPIKSVETGTYRLGVWVRDSSAGIGTLTFYSPATGIVCGLGHGICDEDTGDLLTLESGQLVGAQIVSVTKGSDGNPGELRGKFTYDSLADISLNSEMGVYGKLNGKLDLSRLTEIALRQEVKDGAAQILCTIDGGTPQLYNCTIKKRSSAYLSKTQNLLVTVTDERLIHATGGIVQGMSGSPIIQNGKLVGALTHVLVDNSTGGYGIFAENMLNAVQSVATQTAKEAS